MTEKRVFAGGEFLITDANPKDAFIPEDFDEDKIYYHGGTTIAMEANLLTKKQIEQALADADQCSKQDDGKCGMHVGLPAGDVVEGRCVAGRCR